MRKVYEFRITSISPNQRCIVRMEVLEALIADILRHGQLEPIRITQERNSFLILDGEKR